VHLGMRVSLCVYVCVCVCVRARLCVCACARACMCMCLCVYTCPLSTLPVPKELIRIKRSTPAPEASLIKEMVPSPSMALGAPGFKASLSGAPTAHTTLQAKRHARM
jgi:hypothetical protein